jgi:hypothetical protein
VVTCDGVSCPLNQFCRLTYGVSAACNTKTCKFDSDCDCGVCLNPSQSVYGNCAPRMSVCVSGGRGGAVGSPGGSYGGGGVTGTGGIIIDAGMGGAGGNAIDGSQQGVGG